MPDALLAAGFARNNRLDFLVFEEGAERIGIVAFVRQKFLDAGDQADTWLLSNAACSGGSEGPATDSNIFCQTPFSLQREKRL